MIQRRFALATVVAAALVTVSTLLLGAFGVARYASESNEKWTRLRKVNAVEADVLAVSLALPIWNIDRAQIDKVIQAMEATPAVQAVVVDAAGRTHARARLGDWLMPSDGKFPTDGLLLEQRPIVFNNQRVGTVRLYATPKYIREELRRSLVTMVAEIVALDMLLVLCVYLILWRSVLRPLVAIEKYAVAVSEGQRIEPPAVRPAFAEELEALRASIESMVHGLLEGERALKAETEFNEAAIDSIPGIFFVRDRAGHLVRWNNALARIRNVDDDALRTQMGLSVVLPEDRPLVEDGIREVFEHGRGEGRARVIVDGEVRHFLLNARRMDRDGEAFIVGTGIDITDRQRAQEEREHLQQIVEQSATAWRQTFDSVQTPIIIANQDGVIRRLNQAAAALAGEDATAIAGRSVAAVGGPPWTVAAELIAAFGDGRSSAEARDGLGRVWDITVSSLALAGDDRPLIVVFWEITGIVALQESLRRSERMSAMGALVAGVAHEVRNPLFGMSALLDAYAEELNRNELAEFSDGLRQQVVRLTHLMRELLEFGRPVALALVPGALHDVVEDAINGRARAAAEANVVLHNAVPANLPAMPMDYGRLRQVFENLIDNALQHAPAVRHVTVTARQLLHAGQPSIEFAVEDDGAGFFPEDLSAVFEPFFTRRERGTGLGLSIVQRIVVEEHAGQVRAGNREGGGAVITAVLPVVAPAEHAGATAG